MFWLDFSEMVKNMKTQSQCKHHLKYPDVGAQTDAGYIMSQNQYSYNEYFSVQNNKLPSELNFYDTKS